MTLQQDYRVDSRRIHLVGVSNGAMLAMLVATKMPGVFAGVVSWYGGFLQGMLPDVWSRARRVLEGTSILALHGLKDERIPATGGSSREGYRYEPLAVAVASWASHNGCDGRPSAYALPLPLPLPTSDCSQHRGCSHASVRVAVCLFPNEDHAFWVAGAERLTWDFLSKQSLPVGLEAQGTAGSGRELKVKRGVHAKPTTRGRLSSARLSQRS